MKREKREKDFGSLSTPKKKAPKVLFVVVSKQPPHPSAVVVVVVVVVVVIVCFGQQRDGGREKRAEKSKPGRDGEAEAGEKASVAWSRGRRFSS